MAKQVIKKNAVLEEQVKLTKVIGELKDCIAQVKEQINQLMVEELQLKYYEIESMSETQSTSQNTKYRPEVNLHEKLDLNINQSNTHDQNPEEEDEEEEEEDFK